MKKLIVSVFMFVICLFAFAACNGVGSYDDTDLKNLISLLETENQALQTQINDLIANSGGAKSKIYELGETATVVQNGIEMFSITYVQHDPNIFTARFSIKNLNMPGLCSRMLFAMVYSSSDKTFEPSSRISDTAVPLGESFTYTITVDINDDYIYFGFPIINGGYIPYSIFKV